MQKMKPIESELPGKDKRTTAFDAHPRAILKPCDGIWVECPLDVISTRFSTFAQDEISHELSLLRLFYGVISLLVRHRDRKLWCRLMPSLHYL